jgi:serine/threonine protein kinase
MELANGGALSVLLLQSTLASLPWPARVEILCGVAHGVEYLHSQSVIHLDLKPGNVLLSEGLVPRLSDFGLSLLRRAEPPLRRSGTLHYMAPEICHGEPVKSMEAIDAWGIGCIAHDSAHVNVRADNSVASAPSFDFSVRASWMLRGASRLATGLEKAEFHVSIGEHVPESLAELIRRCLSVQPEARPSAREARVQLEAVLVECRASGWGEGEAAAAADGRLGSSLSPADQVSAPDGAQPHRRCARLIEV